MINLRQLLQKIYEIRIGSFPIRISGVIEIPVSFASRVFQNVFSGELALNIDVVKRAIDLRAAKIKDIVFNDDDEIIAVYADFFETTINLNVRTYPDIEELDEEKTNFINWLRIYGSIENPYIKQKNKEVLSISFNGVKKEGKHLKNVCGIKICPEILEYNDVVELKRYLLQACEDYDKINIISSTSL
jgi:hypothetical protein